MNDAADAQQAIEVRITRIEQLFNSFDPSPFNERDLDEDAEEHIAGWAREMPVDVPLVILLHMPADEAARAQERGLSTALTHYFDVRADQFDRDRRELYRLGWRYLMIGITVLVVCLLVSRSVTRVTGEGPVAQIVQEGLVILGWVANWKPLETFLYDWWPLKRRAALYRRIAGAQVVIRRT